MEEKVLNMLLQAYDAIEREEPFKDAQRCTVFDHKDGLRAEVYLTHDGKDVHFRWGYHAEYHQYHHVTKDDFLRFVLGEEKFNLLSEE